MKKKVIIIGGGFAGLSTGIFLEKNGYETTIYEKNDYVGGLCTTWKRNNYLFESCLYWVFGSNKKTDFYKVLKELGMDKVDFIHFDEYMRLEYDDQKFIVWSDLDKLGNEMKKLSKEDEKYIDKIVKEAKKLQKFNLYIEKPFCLFTLSDYIKFIKSVLPYAHIMLKYKNMPYEKFLKKFKNHKLRHVLKSLMNFVNDYPTLLVFFIFAYMSMGNADYPKGGSGYLANIVKDKYLEYNGNIKYNQEIKRIIVENDTAIGIENVKGEKFYADYIVSCSDGYNTLFKLLEGKYLTNKIKRQYEELPVFISYMQISFGIKKDLNNTPQFIIKDIDKEIVIGKDKIKQLRIRHYGFNNGFAPKNCTSLVVTFEANYDYWNSIYKDKKKYQSEKKRIAKEVEEIIVEKYEISSEDIEEIDIATPKTFERYTYNRKGSAEGWYSTTKTFDETFDQKIKGLNNFYMASHWTSINGGITFASVNGKYVAQMICNNDKKEFKL